jgi:hypothetical protein
VIDTVCGRLHIQVVVRKMLRGAPGLCRFKISIKERESVRKPVVALCRLTQSQSHCIDCLPIDFCWTSTYGSADEARDTHTCQTSSHTPLTPCTPLMHPTPICAPCPHRPQRHARTVLHRIATVYDEENSHYTVYSRNMIISSQPCCMRWKSPHFATITRNASIARSVAAVFFITAEPFT